MKQIAIIGAGTFGRNLAMSLMSEGAEVLIVDINRSKIEALKDAVSRAVIADGANKDVLQELGLTDFDEVVVSLGDRIDVSVMTVLFLKEMNVKRIVAKANNENYGKVLTSVGADDIIFPEKDIAVRVAKKK